MKQKSYLEFLMWISDLEHIRAFFSRIQGSPTNLLHLWKSFDTSQGIKYIMILFNSQSLTNKQNIRIPMGSHSQDFVYISVPMDIIQGNSKCCLVHTPHFTKGLSQAHKVQLILSRLYIHGVLSFMPLKKPNEHYTKEEQKCWFPLLSSFTKV